MYFKFSQVIIIQDNGAKKKDLDSPRKLESDQTLLYIIIIKWGDNSV